MKRLSCLVLAMALVSVMAAGCRRNTDDPTPTDPTVGQTDPTGDPTEPSGTPTSSGALQILQTVWDSYGEEEKFAAVGGDPDNMVDGAPGAFSLEDTDALTYSLAIPAEQLPNIDEAASLVHGMLSNNFTCGVFHLVEGADATSFAQAMYDAVQNSQWMCGMPERVIVAVVEQDYVLMAYGVEDALGLFQQKLTTAYPNTQIAHSAAITG